MRWALLVLIGCGNDEPGDGAPPAPDCVPDDAAGSTWDDAGGVHVAVDDLVVYEYGEFEGRATRNYLPPGIPRGVLIPFEGGKVLVTGDGTKETAQIEWQVIKNELIQAGFAIMATEANPDPDDGDDWDTTHEDRAENDDIDHVLSLWEHLAETTAIDLDTPVLLMSFSGAGNFVNVFAPEAARHGMDVRGASIHNGATFAWSPDDNPYPTVWITAENEWVTNSVVSEGGTGMAYDAYELHRDSGYEALYLPTPEIPFTPTAMLRHPDYNKKPEIAAQVFDDLVSLEILDAGGNRLFDIRDFDDMGRYFVNNTITEGPERVIPQLEIAWGLHRYNGIHAIEECEFLLPAF